MNLEICIDLLLLLLDVGNITLSLPGFVHVFLCDYIVTGMIYGCETSQ